MPTSYDKLGERQAGDPNILKLKDINKIRPLDNVVAGWRQHGIEHPSDGEQFASVVCPGARSCPLCRKPVDAQGNQRFPISRRFAANVYVYEDGAVKVLVAGPQVFDEFKAAATVGIAPDNCDWTITKSGTGRSTEYKVIRHNNEAFVAIPASEIPGKLHDVAKYEMPASTEAIFEILEKFGIDYDALEIPSYTYEEALAFVMPYTKHKGLTLEQLVSQEQDYALWMHGTKLEQGQLGDPVFLALQTVLEEQGLVPSLDEGLASLPEPEALAAEPETASQPAPPGAVPVSNMVKLKSPIGVECDIPAHAADALIAVGYERVEDAPEPEPEAPATRMVLVGGVPQELPAETAQQLIDAGAATDPEAAPEPPSLPLPDEEVVIEVAGTESTMPYVQAAQVVDSVPVASFVDAGVAEAHERAKANAEAQPDPSPTQSPAPSSTSRPVDPEKPHACDQCDKAYKTPGALTQHKNREHKAATPQPSSVPASNGSGDVRERVKQLISTSGLARDYEQLLKIMKDTTGVTDFTKLTDPQLEQLETALTTTLAKA